jgi:hypothetical protein
MQAARLGGGAGKRHLVLERVGQKVVHEEELDDELVRGRGLGRRRRAVGSAGQERGVVDRQAEHPPQRVAEEVDHVLQPVEQQPALHRPLAHLHRDRLHLLVTAITAHDTRHDTTRTTRHDTHDTR